MIFGTSIPKATSHQTAIQFPTSPNICFYTTWGKQNKRNMHWNEQQTSTNWTVVWANEVHRLLTYYSTSCYQTCRLWHVRVSAGQCTSASERKTIELLERKAPDFISLGLWPPTALTSICSIRSSRGSCNSGSIRRRSRMWMNSRSDWLKSGLVWSRTLLTLLSMHGEIVCVLVFAQRADISNIDCSSWTTGQLDKLSARVTEM